MNAQVRRKIGALRRRGLESAADWALADEVHDAKASEASDINNDGLESKVDYLSGVFDDDFVLDLLSQVAEEASS